MSIQIIRFKCSCRKQLKTESRHQGKHVRCPGCQRIVQVPRDRYDLLGCTMLHWDHERDR